MAIDLAGYEKKAREAIMAFWGNREKARQKRTKRELSIRANEQA